MLRWLVRLSGCIFYLLRLLNFCLLIFFSFMLCYHIRWWNKVVYIARLVLAFSSSIADLAGCSLTDCSRWSSHCSDVTGTWNWWSPSLHSSWQVRTIELPSGFVKRSFRGRTLSRYSDQTHTHTHRIIIIIFCFLTLGKYIPEGV